MRPVEMLAKDREEFVGTIISAYAEKELTPMTGAFHMKFPQGRWEPGGEWRAAEGKCCPLGALLHGRKFVDPDSLFGPDIWYDLQELLGWNRSELQAFVQGVDGLANEVSGLAEIVAAYELGQMTRRAIV